MYVQTFDACCAHIIHQIISETLQKYIYLPPKFQDRREIFLSSAMNVKVSKNRENLLIL
jgi:hypothetical protein